MVKLLSEIIKKGDVSYRGVDHTINDTGVNVISGIALGVGFKNPYVGGGMGGGLIIGSQIRIHNNDTNFVGTSLKLNHQYEKFSRNSSGQKTVIKTLRDRLGGHE